MSENFDKKQSCLEKWLRAFNLVSVQNSYVNLISSTSSDICFILNRDDHNTRQSIHDRYVFQPETYDHHRSHVSKHPKTTQRNKKNSIQSDRTLSVTHAPFKQNTSFLHVNQTETYNHYSYRDFNQNYQIEHCDNTSVDRVCLITDIIICTLGILLFTCTNHS